LETVYKARLNKTDRELYRQHRDANLAFQKVFRTLNAELLEGIRYDKLVPPDGKIPQP
jgi:hypothetical protein